MRVFFCLAAAAGVSHPLLDGLTEAELSEMRAPDANAPAGASSIEPEPALSAAAPLGFFVRDLVPNTTSETIDLAPGAPAELLAGLRHYRLVPGVFPEGMGYHFDGLATVMKFSFSDDGTAAVWNVRRASRGAPSSTRVEEEPQVMPRKTRYLGRRAQQALRVGRVPRLLQVHILWDRHRPDSRTRNLLHEPGGESFAHRQPAVADDRHRQLGPRGHGHARDRGGRGDGRVFGRVEIKDSRRLRFEAR